MPLTVDVVIPAYNEEDSLPLVLAAIPRPPVRRVVVVDNASTDGTAAVVGRYDVPWHPLGTNRGFGAACNAGAAMAAGDVIVVLTHDTVPSPGCLRSQFSNSWSLRRRHSDSSPRRLRTSAVFSGHSHTRRCAVGRSGVSKRRRALRVAAGGLVRPRRAGGGGRGPAVGELGHRITGLDRQRRVNDAVRLQP